MSSTSDEAVTNVAAARRHEPVPPAVEPGGPDGPEAGTPDADGRPGYAFPVAWFLAIGAVLWIVSALSVDRLGMNAGYPAEPIPFPGDGFFGGWFRWDAGWYVNIATNGYWWKPGEMSSVAFFPTYPSAMRMVHAVLPGVDLALIGIAITAVAGLGSAVLLYRWACRKTSRTVARVTVLVLLLYPYAWYLYGAMYADALFLVCVLGAFLLLEQDRPVLAGIVAIAATAARPVGTGVVLGLAAVVLERREIVVIPYLDRVRALGWRAARRERPETADAPPTRRRIMRALVPVVHLRNLRIRDLGVGLSILGLAGWMLYLARTFGDPLLFVKAQSAPGWNQGQGPRVWIKGPWLRGLTRVPQYVSDLSGSNWDAFIYTSGTTFQAVLVLGALCLVPLVIRRLGWGYAAYVIGVVGIPLMGSKDWQGTGRYLLAAFPVVLVVAAWLVERCPPRTRAAWFIGSGLLLVVLTSSFARGFYLA